MNQAELLNGLQQSVGCAGYQAFDRRRWLLNSSAATFAFASPLTTLAEAMARGEVVNSNAKAKSLILLWMQGGPSQLETFDPHVNSIIGGDVQSLKTSVSDLYIADSLPQTAQQMHRTTLIRSMTSKEGDHERATSNFKTGWRPEPTLQHPSIGSIIAHASPSNIELPNHITILPGQWPSRGGFLGPKFDAFAINDPSESLPNLSSPVGLDRRAKRLQIMRQIADREFARGRISDLDALRLQQQHTTDSAVALMDTTQLAALDLSQEDRDTRTSFGENAFGRGCLAALRLISQGVRCVEVELTGWDSHVNNHALQYSAAATLDAALASLLEQLEERNLLDSTIVVCSGEFGRTPKINLAGGRDHWPTGFSTLVAGGNFRRGHVHGKTNFEATEPSNLLNKKVESPVRIEDLHATILHQCGIDPATQVNTPIGRPIAWSEGKLRSELLN